MEKARREKLKNRIIFEYCLIISTLNFALYGCYESDKKQFAETELKFLTRLTTFNCSFCF